jgi:hypothetical protein
LIDLSFQILREWLYCGLDLKGRRITEMKNPELHLNKGALKYDDLQNFTWRAFKKHIHARNFSTMNSNII